MTPASAVAGWTRDPVCREWVHVATAAATAAEHEGRTFHFCDARCRARFLAEPARFLAAHG